MDIWTWIPLILMLVMFALRVPVAYSMIIAAAVYQLFGPNSMSVTTLIQKMQSSQESFVYLAIPFFTTAGVVFNYCGITRRIMNLADVLVGHITGGMGHVNCLVSTLMGGLSGSSNADAAMECKLLVPEMEKRGYGKGFSCAVTAASSAITAIIPPGIILILYATAANESVAKMFYGGYIPGALLCIALMVTVYIISKRRKYKPSREHIGSPTEIWSAFKDSFWALLIPFGILMGLRGGMFTPTEAGAVCIVYSIFVGAVIYRELKLKDLIPILKESLVATAGVMFILAGANGLSSYLTWESLPQRVTALIIDVCHNQWQFLLLVNVLLLVIGCFFDAGAAMILCAPLLVPAAQSFGLNLIHFGIVMCVNLQFGGFTPPFGAMMFITTSVTDTPVQDYIKEIWPFLLASVACLMLFTYVPDIVMFLPNIL